MSSLTPPLTDGTVEIYVNGIVHCSVCAPADMSLEVVTEAVNRRNPTGLESPWAFDNAPTFSSGEPNPCPCEKDDSRLHYLFTC